MSNKKEIKDGKGNIKRRTVLKSAAAGVGIAGMSGLATAGEPCFKDFECSGDATYVKFEFDEDACSFEEETDTGLITIDSYTSKEGETCEPISVEWSVADGYGAIKVEAYGGQDCTGPIEDPDPDQTFTPELVAPSGQTAAISNLQFCVEKVEETVELPSDSYIGYEDRPASGDFDYNDFGMRADISETYLGDELQTIDMEFKARFHRAGDSHEIHIERTFGDGVDYDYTVTRSESAAGSEVTGGSYSGSGTLDLLLFDTDDFTQDETVSVTLTVTSGSVSPPTTSPRPDVAANNPLFEVYDPYMVNTSQSTTIDLGTVQDNIDKSESNWDNVADVPNIIVVPDTGFVAPSEGTTITADYPNFDDYYADDNADTGDSDGDLEVDSNYDDWF